MFQCNLLLLCGYVDSQANEPRDARMLALSSCVYPADTDTLTLHVSRRCLDADETQLDSD